MAATFPSSPTNGQTAEVGGRYYTWNSTASVWENTGAASGLASAANLSVSGTTTTTTANIGNVNVTGTISAGHTNPSTNNTYDLGTSSLRWRNIYTNDLNLSNGIGDYTIVEGEEDLFLYNNKNGKTYKFLIQEVDPTTAPPKGEK